MKRLGLCEKKNSMLAIPKMCNKFRSFALLTAIALIAASLLWATPPTPQLDITHENIAPGNTTSLSLPSTIGWVYYHPANCTMFTSKGIVYLTVYTVEGPSLSTSSAKFQSLLGPACQTGNFLGFYIDDTKGDWDELYTYTYK